jgi:hypothetical protein
LRRPPQSRRKSATRQTATPGRRSSSKPTSEGARFRSKRPRTA